ncbi:MAG: Flp pilus assembly complex ATPase component TadA [Clostridia bacterium]|nr:Flp pilus assembly complex ATPase component TadA [Clostridia bacterium]
MLRFNEITEYFDFSLKSRLNSIPDKIKSTVTEIRVKVNQPIVIITLNDRYYLSEYGLSITAHNSINVSRDEFNECIKKMCNYSFFTFENQINEGYLTLKNGHRVGVCGSFSNNGEIISCNDIYSLNIRIARHIKTFGKYIAENFINTRNHLLISGKPLSGKTTLIRDIAYELSTNKIKVLVSDERNEIAAGYNGKYQFSLGPFCDVISNCKKEIAAEIGIRTMSPDVIIFDEIGFKDADILKRLSNSGVYVIATFHSFDDSSKSYILNQLLDVGFSPTVIHLDEIGEAPRYDFTYENN